MFQVLHHRNSTERQYALENKAVSLGWDPENIKILDGDLGLSGTQMKNREHFKLIVADVSMNKVGAIFVLEASRLSRSSNDWNRLLELCALTQTLIIDEDGVYDPCLFNDQLLLGLKGTMSQAELHLIRARLHGGKLNKARKGELRFALPVGYGHDAQNKTAFDEDSQVVHTINMLFRVFRETQSAYAVVQYFGKNSISFPKRAYGGAWNGKLIWGKLNYNRALTILKHPFYAGAYTYGRYKTNKIISPGGEVKNVQQKMPMDKWDVMIKGHHPGYICWEEFEKNQILLKKNKTNIPENITPAPARKGHMLLQGALLCGTCGRRISVRYKGNGGIYPTYECNGRKKDGETTNHCISFRSDIADKEIEKKIIQVLTPKKIAVAMKSLDELDKRDSLINKNWEMKIQRARYEVELAERRYEQVDPANRLVAANLENKWNNALLELKTTKEQYAEYQQANKYDITQERKKELSVLSKDIPKLWAKTKNYKDKKRIVRLLIKDITVRKKSETNQLLFQIRWQGGIDETCTVNLPPKIYETLKYKQEIIDKVKFYAAKKDNDIEIARSLNKSGYSSATKKPFTKSMIQWIRYKHNIPLLSNIKENEYTVTQVTKKFNVSRHMVYYWTEKNIVSSRKIRNNSQILITIGPKDEGYLFEKIRSSYKLKS
jgi:DNA invertase Pin-like site-specific DNA recombinase